MIPDRKRLNRKARRGFKALCYFLGALNVLSVAPNLNAEEPKFIVERTDPPQFGFYAKSVDCNGVVIRSSVSVDDGALLTACERITTILSQMDVSRHNLRQRGVELHIFGNDQSILDLPENRDQGLLRERVERVTSVPVQVRAKSGIYSACGQENLFVAPPDGATNSEDMCMRVFAIALMNYGFDDEIRRQIDAQYRTSVSAGHWQGTPAAVSPEDYWAELSLRFFGACDGFLRTDQLPPVASGGLRQYDPAGFGLLDSIYSGRKRPIPVEAVRARSVSNLALSRVSRRPAELQLVNNGAQRIRVFWIDTEGVARSLGELGPYSRMIEPTFFFHVWMLEDQRGVELQRFVVEDYLSEVIAED